MFNKGKIKELEEAVDKARQEAAWYKTCYEFEKKMARLDAKTNVERLEQIDTLTQKVNAEKQRADGLAKILSNTKEELAELRKQLAVEHTYRVWVGNNYHDVKAFGLESTNNGTRHLRLTDRDGMNVAEFVDATSWQDITASGDTSGRRD